MSASNINMWSAVLDGTLMAQIAQLQLDNQSLKFKTAQLIQQLRQARAERDGARKIIGAVRRRDIAADEHF